MDTEYIKPPFLKPGDKVSIVSPSGVVEREPVLHAVRLIESWGLTVVVGRHAFASCGIFAGTDRQRLADLQDALDDMSVRAVFCSRGGYGLSRIISSIDFSGFLANPKWLAGFSDVTVLHQWVGNIYGIASVHGEMPVNFANPLISERSVESLRQILFGEEPGYKWEGGVVNAASATGLITGGNLSLLYSLAGTIARPYTRGRILFIEDNGEYYHSLDRMLSSLKVAGLLDGLSALLAGSFTNMQEDRIAYGSTAEEIITGIAGPYGYPLYFNFPAGHGNDNMAFMPGKRMTLSREGDYSILS